LQYSGLKDAKVSRADIVLSRGRRWKVTEAVQQAEARLKAKALLGTVAQGRAGFRSSKPTCCNTDSKKERSRLA